MLKSVSLLLLTASFGCVRSNEEVRRAPPDQTLLVQGKEKSIAECAVEHLLDGSLHIVPLLRDPPGKSVISAVGDGLSGQILYWELRFEQVDEMHARAQLWTRKTLFSNGSSAVWPAVRSCAGTR